MSECVPNVTFPNSDRLSRVCELFKEKHGSSPTYLVRAPGRVNLIGEHIDYCGYAVLPMAIDQDILIAAGENDDNKIRLSNVASYADFTCDVNSYTIDKSSPQWYHYFLCGYRGIAEYLKVDDSTGVDAVVSGTIPPSAGLSSSSALVCASALVTAAIHRHGRTITKAQFAQICCDCEKYIGTIGGGMDQSISFLAEAGTAKLIEFNPIRASDVVLPSGVVFVISHSLAELNKAATSQFNQRVVECRLASQVLAARAGLALPGPRRLGDLQHSLGKSFQEMLDFVKQSLHPDPYTKAELCDLLNVSPEELVRTHMSENTAHLESFKLQQRAMHVFSEASRVREFKAICDEKPSNAVELLGELMNSSHLSTRDLYECSHPDLDRLVTICLASGAIGSRLTGAGWGGCAVSLVRQCDLDAFLMKVTREFYSPERLGSRKIDEVLFATQPGAGAMMSIPE